MKNSEKENPPISGEVRAAETQAPENTTTTCENPDCPPAAEEESPAEGVAETQPLPPAGMISREEAERMAQEAYLRGKNEAIRSEWIGSPDDGEKAPGPDDAASVFRLRPSVWDKSF